MATFSTADQRLAFTGGGQNHHREVLWSVFSINISVLKTTKTGKYNQTIITLTISAVKIRPLTRAKWHRKSINTEMKENLSKINNGISKTPFISCNKKITHKLIYSQHLYVLTVMIMA